MRQIWRILSHFMVLHATEYTGQFVISWKDGVPQHTKADANRLPDELPGDDEALLKMLRQAQDEAA